MHDLDRNDLMFESNGFEPGLEELDDPDVELETDDGVFDEIEQAELASDLLSVTDDHELDRFVGRLFRRGRKALAGATAKKLGGLLKGAINTALPTIAGAAIGGPAGAALASNLAPHLSSLLGMELEGLSPEDQELEAAKQLIRLSGSAIENAANTKPGTPPEIAARNAMIDAARRHAPGLLRRAAAGSHAGAQHGTWVRHGNKIVIHGV